MSIEKHFGLNELPYRLSPDPRFLYYSAEVREAVEKCKYMTGNQIGPVYLYGSIGSGKTTLLKLLADVFKADPAYRVAHLISPNVRTSNAFLRMIMDEFDVKAQRAYAQSLRSFASFLLRGYGAGTPSLLLVDEAQNMTRDTLRLIHYLLNFETSRAKLLQIVLAGQHRLAERIMRFRELSSRMFPIALCGMAPDDLAAMVQYRWMVAGGKRAPFTPRAQRVIFTYTRGLPRDAVKLCGECLRFMTARGRKTISPLQVESVAKGLNLRP